jgi:NADH dehydrogenase
MAGRADGDTRAGPTAPRAHRVVVVGGGFAGLTAARELAGAPVDITLVDQANHHCFQPLLYQVATATLSPAEVAWPIRAILRRQANARVAMARVTDVDVAAREVVTSAGRLPYDTLVLATGAGHDYFGNDDWARFAPGLKRVEDAVRIRARVLMAFEQAELSVDPTERARLLTFVIVGGGPTGVEMAGAIAEVARHALREDFRRIDPRRARILLVEAGPRVLGGFPYHLSDYTRAALARLGVEVITDRPVTGCDARGVDLGEERIEAATLVWAAGVKASPAARWLGAAHDRAGRVEVAADLTVPGHPEIFAIGDTAAVPGPDGTPVPGIAPAAKQMGSHAAAAIRARLGGGTPPGPFVYRHRGDLATIGRRAAVVRLKRTELKGLAGWLFWSVAHIYFLIGARNRAVVAFLWLWNYLTLQRGVRLITFPPDDGAVTARSDIAPAAPDPRVERIDDLDEPAPSVDRRRARAAG